MKSKRFRNQEACEFHGWQETQRGDHCLTIPMVELLDRIRILSLRMDRAAEGSPRYHRLHGRIVSCQEAYRRMQAKERAERNRRSEFTGKRIRKVIRFIMGKDDYDVSL